MARKRDWSALASPPLPSAKARREAENASHIGGMQSPSASVAKLPVLDMQGQRVRSAFSAWVSASVDAQ
eukprot:4298327-Amphidinium_carterae.1